LPAQQTELEAVEGDAKQHQLVLQGRSASGIFRAWPAGPCGGGALLMGAKGPQRWALLICKKKTGRGDYLPQGTLREQTF
jgi:hypothetical protein